MVFCDRRNRMDRIRGDRFVNELPDFPGVKRSGNLIRLAGS